MRVLLDEQLPTRLRRDLGEHDVVTVEYLGWKGVRNGKLLARAAEAGFEVFVTADRGIAHSQNLETIPLSVVILHARSTSIVRVRPLVPELLALLKVIQPNTLTHVGNR